MRREGFPEEALDHVEARGAAGSPRRGPISRVSLATGWMHIPSMVMSVLPCVRGSGRDQGLLGGTYSWGCGLPARGRPKSRGSPRGLEARAPRRPYTPIYTRAGSPRFEEGSSPGCSRSRPWHRPKSGLLNVGRAARFAARVRGWRAVRRIFGSPREVNRDVSWISAFGERSGLVGALCPLRLRRRGVAATIPPPAAGPRRAGGCAEATEVQAARVKSPPEAVPNGGRGQRDAILGRRRSKGSPTMRSP